MSKWLYNGRPLLEPPENTYGFTYCVFCILDNSYYIGCKSFWSTTNALISKKRANELYSGHGSKKKREKKTTESNWKVYNTSSSTVRLLIEQHGEQNFRFEILKFYKTKTELHLGEALKIIECACDPKLINKWLKCTIFLKQLDCNK